MLSINFMASYILAISQIRAHLVYVYDMIIIFVNILTYEIEV